MRKVARQYLLLTYVCDLAKSMPGRDARDAIKPLFKKMVRNRGMGGQNGMLCRRPGSLAGGQAFFSWQRE